MDKISELALEQKAALLASEKRIQAELVRIYGAIYQRISSWAQTVQLQEQPLDQAKLQELQAAIERELREFARQAAELVTLTQLAALKTGATDALSLLGASGVESAASGQALSVANQKALEAIAGAAGDGSPLRLLFGRMAPAVARSVVEELQVGVVEGAGPRVIATRIRERAGMSLTRALLIARQEPLRAYREAARMAYQHHTGVIRWRWLASLDVRTCALCWAMDGREFPLTVKFTSHIGCRCSMVPVTEKSSKAITGAERFDELEPGQQLEILGPQKFKLYKERKITLDQLVGVRYSAEWGLVRYEKSAQELLRAV